MPLSWGQNGRLLSAAAMASARLSSQNGLPLAMRAELPENYSGKTGLRSSMCFEVNILGLFFYHIAQKMRRKKQKD